MPDGEQIFEDEENKETETKAEEDVKVEERSNVKYKYRDPKTKKGFNNVADFKALRKAYFK